MVTQDAINLSEAMRRMAALAEEAVRGFGVLADIVAAHREQWLCKGEGQWPDKFTLLNRYVRTGLEPPFIINV